MTSRVMNWPLWGVLLVGTTASPRTMAAQGSLPTIVARVVVTAPEFADPLYGNFVSDLPGIERAATAELTRIANHLLGFVRWTPAGDSSVDSTTASLALEVYKKGRSFGARITTRFLLRFPGDPLVDTLVAPIQGLVDLYDIGDAKPTQDSALFRSDLTEFVSRQFNHEGFRNWLHRQYLSAIPLTDRIEADTINRKLVVPVRWQDLRALSGSELGVDFVAAVPTSDSGIGRIELRLSREALHSGLVECTVMLFDFGSIQISGFGSWDAQIPVILAHVVNGKVVVKMEKYVPDPRAGRSGGIILDPEGGGPP